MKYDLMTRLKRGMVLRFGHVQRMDVFKLMAQNGPNVDENVGRDRPRRIFLKQIGNVLEKVRIKSTKNKRACMKRMMSGKETKEVCEERSRWRSMLSSPMHV